MAIHAYSPTEPRIIIGPPCPKCAGTTFIIRMEPGVEPKAELRTFQCVVCNEEVALVVQFGPAT